MLQRQIEAGQQVLINFVFNKALCTLTVNLLTELGQEMKGGGQISEK